MSRTLRVLLATAAVQLALSYAPVATAAKIAISLPPCDRFELTGTPPDQSLECIVTSVPVCTIGGGNTTAQINTDVTLSANCLPSATSFLWSGGSCAGKTAPTCKANEGTAGAVVTYGVVGTNSIGSSTGVSTTVTWTAAPPSPPVGCTLTPSASTVPAAGALVTLTAACDTTSGPTPTKYVWAGPGINSQDQAGSLTTVQSLQVVPPATYTVTAYNGSTAGTKKSVTITATGGTPTGSIDCGPGFGATKVIDAQFTPGFSYRYWTDRAGTFANGASVGFYANNAVVVRFVAPGAGDPSLFLEMYETGAATYGRAAKRTAVLSTEKCDFAIPASTNAVYAVTGSQTVSIALRTDGGGGVGDFQLIPGRTYYLNVKNSTPENPNTCSAARCDVFFSFNNPL